ncbi:MAG: hypothetical protein ABIK44_00640, partial [candidate division WOR-3 bacterium]
NFLVVWQDYRNNPDTSDIYGARVRPDGTVYDEGPIVRQEGSQLYPALARGTGSHLFLVYEGWTGTVGGKTYNTQRIWGKLNPAPAIGEERWTPDAGRQTPHATIVRGVLLLPASGVARGASSLLDASGRKVMELVPGPNDVRHLAPGVYFIQAAFPAGRGALAAERVVIVR